MRGFARFCVAFCENKKRQAKLPVLCLISLSEPHLTQLVQYGILAIVDLSSLNSDLFRYIVFSILLSVDDRPFNNEFVFAV